MRATNVRSALAQGPEPVKSRLPSRHGATGATQRRALAGSIFHIYVAQKRAQTWPTVMMPKPIRVLHGAHPANPLRAQACRGPNVFFSVWMKADRTQVRTDLRQLT